MHPSTWRSRFAPLELGHTTCLIVSMLCCCHRCPKAIFPLRFKTLQESMHLNFWLQPKVLSRVHWICSSFHLANKCNWIHLVLCWTTICLNFLCKIEFWICVILAICRIGPHFVGGIFRTFSFANFEGTSGVLQLPFLHRCTLVPFWLGIWDCNYFDSLDIMFWYLEWQEDTFLSSIPKPVFCCCTTSSCLFQFVVEKMLLDLVYLIHGGVLKVAMFRGPILLGNGKTLKFLIILLKWAI